MNIDNHTREILQAMLDGKKLLYKQGRPDWQASFWLLILSGHDAEHVTIATEPKITTWFFRKCVDQTWGAASSHRCDFDTHYLQLDETGKQVAFGPVEELKV